MLPHVIRYNGANGQSVGHLYRDLLRSSGHFDGQSDAGTAAESLATVVRQLSHAAGLAGTLSECGVTSDRLPDLATAAAQQWTGTFNPVEVTRDGFHRLYEAAM
jgi:alcohol dehydrogenase